MKRREFFQLSLGAAALVTTGAFAAEAPKAVGGSKIADKDVLKDGMPATIANYCEHPEKQPNKACPGAKEKPGNCETCQFFNRDNSLADFKGGKYAHCQLLTDPSKPQFVSSKGWCATFVKKMS